MRRCVTPLALLTLLALLLGSSLGAAPAEREEFHYRWRLTNFLGKIAGLFFPDRGDGLLSFEAEAPGRLVSQLEITSEKSKAGEFWLYGAEIEVPRLRTLRAWSAYKYGDKDKSKEAEVARDGVLDVASAIYSLRVQQPTRTQRLDIWSDGKTYPVRIEPKGVVWRKVDGERVRVRHYVIRGVQKKKDERRWKGELELWLSTDEEAMPVAIFVRRKGLGVLLELEEAVGATTVAARR